MTNLLFKRGNPPLNFTIFREYNNGSLIAISIHVDYIDRSSNLLMTPKELSNILELDSSKILPIEYVLTKMLETTKTVPSKYIIKKYGTQFTKIINDTANKLRNINGRY